MQTGLAVVVGAGVVFRGGKQIFQHPQAGQTLLTYPSKVISPNRSAPHRSQPPTSLTVCPMAIFSSSGFHCLMLGKSSATWLSDPLTFRRPSLTERIRSLSVMRFITTSPRRSFHLMRDSVFQFPQMCTQYPQNYRIAPQCF